MILPISENDQLLLEVTWYFDILFINCMQSCVRCCGIMLWANIIPYLGSVSESVRCCCSDFSVCIGLSPTLLLVNVSVMLCNGTLPSLNLFFWSKCNSMQSVFSVKINKKSILDKEYSSLQRQQFKLELITNRGAFFWVISQLSCCSGILSLGDCAAEPSPREECSLCQASTWSEVRCVGFVCLFFRNAFCANTDLVTEPRWKRLSIKIELNQIASSEVQNCQNHCWLYWLFVVWG